MKTTKGSKLIPTIFVGKWTVKVLFSLHERPYRPGQLRRRIGRVSLRMLTRTLRNLESTRLIARRVTGPKALAVEYSLTELGRTFIAPLDSMCRWENQHRKDVSAEVHLVETQPA